MPLVIRIGSVEEGSPIRKRVRAARGSRPHAGMEAAEKPVARKGDRSEDENENENGNENEMGMARGPRMMPPPPPRRTRRGGKGRFVAKSKPKGAA
jgi:hypothetical protein